MTPTDGSAQGGRLDDLLRREWLITNHLGGYASSSIPCCNTRKYHGLLVAAMTPPVHRMVLLSRVEEVVHCDGWPTPLACNEYPGTVHPDGNESLRAFSHEPFPRWAYQGEGWTIEKSLQLIDGENTVILTYTLLGKKSIDLELRPLMALRSMHELMYQWNGKLAAEEKSPGGEGGHHRIPPTARTPEVFFAHDGDDFQGDVGGEGETGTATWYFNTIYRREQERGYAGLEDLWSPGVIRWKRLQPGESVHFVCSADPIDLEKTVAASEMQCPSSTVVTPPAAITPHVETDHDRLVRAAGAFVLNLSPEQIEKNATAMITKLPWSPPSARDALIALAGILLVTGRFAEAKAMLLGLAARMRSGLVPTEFAEKASEPETFNGVDTSLWFVNAVWQYLRYTGDEATVGKKLLDAVMQIVRTYHHGANAGIAADRDGLLTCCSPGRGFTWMDARFGDVVVTPRAGKAVEVNALWYNAVRIAAALSERFGQPTRTRELNLLADTIAIAFNQKFWNEREACCFDVVTEHGPDPSIRPNQLFAVSLPFAVLNVDRHDAVVDRVASELMTPFGPRTLTPRDPAYQGRYGGDVASRERACHQGCVHPWILGAFVTAYLRVHGRGEGARNEARRRLEDSLALVGAHGLGHLCELFDGDAPHRPGGAIASAPAVGELLRCYVEDILDQQPKAMSATMPRPADVTVTIKPKVAT